MQFHPELFGAASALLGYLSLKPSESLLVTADSRTDEALVQALVGVAFSMGVRPVVMTMPLLPYQGKLADPYLPRPLQGAAEMADVWIDLTFPYIAGADLHARVMERGQVRYMLMSDLDSEGLIRLMGGGNLERVLDASERFERLVAGRAGSTVRITTPLGTDVSYQLVAPKRPLSRTASEPGMYTVPGAMGIYPDIESVVGKIVIESVFHEHYTSLRHPLTLHVDGRIQRVEGHGPDKLLLERALKRAGGGQYGYVIHFTHGVHAAARMRGTCFVEDMRTLGCNAVGLGLPWWEPEGGENHPDAVISSQSIWLDGALIVDGSAPEAV